MKITKTVKTVMALSLLLSISSQTALASSTDSINPTQVQYDLDFKNQKKSDSKNEEIGSSIKSGVEFNYQVSEEHTAEEAENFYQTSMEVIQELENLTPESQKDDEIFSPMIVVDNGFYNARVLRTSNNYFKVNSVTAVKDVLHTGLSVLIAYSGFKWVTTATKSAGLNALSLSTAKAVGYTGGPDYTSSKLVTFYHSGYKDYVLQEYINIYTDSSRTKVKSVKLGPVLLESNGLIRDVKW